jgi:hypothetical protein
MPEAKPTMRFIVQLAYRSTPIALVNDDDEMLVTDDQRAFVMTQEALDALEEVLL